MSVLKGVAIGVGYFSQFHLEAWSRLEGAELVAICDHDESRVQEQAKKYNVPKAYSDFTKMLDAERPDFVDIITRPDSHLNLCKLAFDKKIPVICQKPLAPTFTEAQEIIQMAEDASVSFMVHENFRFQPWYREIKSLLDAQAIGSRMHSVSIRTRTGDGWPKDAYLARQPYFREMPRFLVHETGVHFIDTFRYLFGEIEGVYASLRKLNEEIQGEDCGILHFEFANGSQGIWDANRFNEPNCEDPRYTFGEAAVEGNGGTIRLYSDGRITLQKLGQKEKQHSYQHERVQFAGDCVFQTQKHFVEALKTSKEFETSGTEYLKTLKVQEAIYASAKSGLPVRGLTAGSSS